MHQIAAGAGGIIGGIAVETPSACFYGNRGGAARLKEPARREEMN